MPTDKRAADRDINDFLARKFTKWIKRQPKDRVFFVECNRDYHERNEMQFMREQYGLDGTAYFTPVQVF